MSHLVFKPHIKTKLIFQQNPYQFISSSLSHSSKKNYWKQMFKRVNIPKKLFNSKYFLTDSLDDISLSSMHHFCWFFLLLLFPTTYCQLFTSRARIIFFSLSRSFVRCKLVVFPVQSLSMLRDWLFKGFTSGSVYCYTALEALPIARFALPISVQFIDYYRKSIKPFHAYCLCFVFFLCFASLLVFFFLFCYYYFN